MPTQQMPGATPIEITQEDLKDPNLTNLNNLLRQLTIMANILAGAHGSIPFTKDLNMQGNSLDNVKSITTTAETLTGAPPTVSKGQVGLGSTTATTATAGAGILPSNPTGFLEVNIAGVVKKIPYYNS